MSDEETANGETATATDGSSVGVELSLDGVALRRHDEPYPFDYDPYAHQLRMAELIRGDDGFVAVNDSPTGGGKTSSWLAPALAEQLDTVAIYPTNALVTDQERGISDELDSVDHDVRVLTVTSERLAKKRSDFDADTNGEAVERWYRAARRQSDQVILLTNPDIFVMMCRDLYRKESREYRRISLAVVDEFHRAGRKERNTLGYLLDELSERPNTQSRLDKIAFLSATPDEEQERQFDHAMAAPYHRVTDSGDGSRTTNRRAFTDDLGESWNAVMPPVDLDIRVAPTFGTADVLLEEDAEDLREFCAVAEGSAEAVAVVLDGIHEVKRVYDFLDAELDCRVERIDGFHSEDKREKLDEFDVLVSNSAVEVGIDFDIDRLLFAGQNRGRFLQRLGRLRTKEERCLARCYIPREVARSFSTDERVTGDESLTRAALDDVLDDAYPTPREPESFGWRYSAPEALEHLDDRVRDTPSDREDEIVAASGQRIQRHFLDGTGVRLGQEDIQRTKEEIDWRVLRELQWYRGDSTQALVYDRTEETVRAYNLFYLLRYGDVTFYEADTFEQLIPDSETDTFDRLRRYVDGFCTYDGTIRTTDEGYGRSVAFTGPQLAGWLGDDRRDSDRRPQVLESVQLTVEPSEDGQPRVTTLDRVNDRLETRRNRLGEAGGVLCYPLSLPQRVVTERYDLGDFFFLYPVALGDQQACLALGTDALYLHCHVMEEEERDIGTGGTDEDDLIGGVSRS